MTTGLAPEHSEGAGRRPVRTPRVWLGAAGLVLLLVVVLLIVRARGRAGARSAGPGGPGAEARPVSVLTTTVVARDVPIYLDGLGNVVPNFTVTVRTQVDGRLDRVVFTEGQVVHPGDVLALVDPRPFLIQLHTGEANLFRDTAQLRDARLNLERYRLLAAKDLAPQQQVDDQQALADTYEGNVKADRTQIESAQLNLDYARIRSPIEGLAGIRQVDPGNIVHPGDATGIVVITQLDPISVVFTLPQDDLQRVLKELAVTTLPVDALSRNGAQKLGHGDLAFVDNQVNVTTGTIRLKAVFKNPESKLWPSLFVKARVLLMTRKGVTVVPSSVVQRGPQGMFAYVVGADQTVAVRKVDIDSTQGEQSIIAAGLAVGETVVSDGQNQLRPGAKVAGRPAPPPAASSGAP